MSEIDSQLRDLLRSILKSVEFCKELDLDEIDELTNCSELKLVSYGEVVCREGDEADSLMIIIEGSVKVTKLKPDGTEVLFGTLTSGRTFGEMALVDHEVRSATVSAVEDAMLLVIDQVAFETLIESRTKIGYKLLRGIARSVCTRLRELSDDYTELSS